MVPRTQGTKPPRLFVETRLFVGFANRKSTTFLAVSPLPLKLHSQFLGTLFNVLRG